MFDLNSFCYSEIMKWKEKPVNERWEKKSQVFNEESKTRAEDAGRIIKSCLIKFINKHGSTFLIMRRQASVKMKRDLKSFRFCSSSERETRVKSTNISINFKLSTDLLTI